MSLLLSSLYIYTSVGKTKQLATIIITIIIVSGRRSTLNRFACICVSLNTTHTYSAKPYKFCSDLDPYFSIFVRLSRRNLSQPILLKRNNRCLPYASSANWSIYRGFFFVLLEIIIIIIIKTFGHICTTIGH